MDISKALETIKEKYPKTSSIDLNMFEKWLREFNTFDYEAIIYTIIKADNRDSYINQLPTYQEYNKFYDQNKSSFNGNTENKNSLDYIFNKTKNYSVQDILLKCKKIRVEIKSEEWARFDDWNKNSRADFLHQWDILSAEQYQAEKRGLAADEIRTYLEMIKKAIVEGKKWDRPWSSDYKMLELKRIAHVASFDKIAEKIL